jgi:NAD-dependent dihydropyrimidine dehydrogenase PreA subunit
MSKRALIYRMRKDGQTYYRFLPSIIGFWDFQANKAALRPEFAGSMFEYIGSGYGQTVWSGKSPIFRYLPINTEVVQGNQVLPYDDVLDIVSSKRSLAVMNCQCRQLAATMGNACKHANHPQETCFYLDDWADFFVENGDARYITLDEFKVLLKSAEEEGLLVEAANVKDDVGVICMCCSCCCGPLTALNLFPSPSRQMISNYLCRRDDSLCIKGEGCTVCTERCIVGAQKIIEGDVVLDQASCVGCGLCVSKCPAKALILEVKPEDRRPVRARDVFDLNDMLAAERLG